MEKIQNLIFCGLIGIIISCTPIIKTDLKNYMENPEAYKGRNVIIKADLESLMANPSPYESKKIELSGNVKFDNRRSFFTWNFIVTDNDKAIRCYEKEYRTAPWTVPVMLVKRALRENEKITVVGRFHMGYDLPELELDWIEYKGHGVDTDYKPQGIRFPFR